MNHNNISKLIQLFKQSTPNQIHEIFAQLAKKFLFIPTAAEHPIHAAVLLPIVLHEEPTIILTQRTSHLNHHPGQISFPGGKIDEEDQDPKACILREVEEEIGLKPEKIEILGNIGEWPSFSGYSVTPFIGLIKPPIILKACDHEVEEIFEMPLQYAFDIKNFDRIMKETPTPHYYYQTIYQNKKIWGFTASLLALMSLFINSN